jgi:hypothetical protein
MNLHVCATGVVKTPSGQDMPFNESFDLYQTRTEDTYEILKHKKSEDIFKAYISLYALYAPGTEHKNELKIWLKNMQGYGFEIYWFAM